MLPLCYLTVFDTVGVLLNSLSLFVSLLMAATGPLVLLLATFLQEEFFLFSKKVLLDI